MGRQVSIDLTSMAHGGEAVGRHEGKAVFVPFGIPGESVRVEITQDKGRFARARLLEVLSGSAERVVPPCSYFGACGGCHFQHVSYAAQLEYKRSIVQTQMERIAGLSEAVVLPTLGMSDPWHYRNHVQFHVSDTGRLGFMAAGSHDVVPIERCPLMHPLLDDLFEALDAELPGLLRLALRAGIRTGDQMVIFEMESSVPPQVTVDLPVSCVLQTLDGSVVTLVGSPHIREQVGTRTYRVSAPSFFQVNTAQAELLADRVITYLDAGPNDVVVDAYSGVGMFSIGLAAHPARRVGPRQIIGIESSPDAIRDAQANASGLEQVSFVCGAVEEMLPALGIRPTLVVVDPPRTGLGRQTVTALLDLSPARIVYVSCDPATLGRDVRAFSAAGYRLREAQPIDMFPQTYHVETVAVLERG
jgi:23S rRNA (uracil1939-C5)-methyltransferase